VRFAAGPESIASAPALAALERAPRAWAGSACSAPDPARALARVPLLPIPRCRSTRRREPLPAAATIGRASPRNLQSRYVGPCPSAFARACQWGRRRAGFPSASRCRLILPARMSSPYTSTEHLKGIYECQYESRSRHDSTPNLDPDLAEKVILPSALFVISPPGSPAGFCSFQAAFRGFRRDTAASIRELEPVIAAHGKTASQRAVQEGGRGPAGGRSRA
jgi:hypothetical protein